MTIEILLTLFLTLSIALNVFLYTFSREQARRLLIVSENISDLLEMVGNYREHLRKVYNLDTFYGDETLGFLMEHTRALTDLLGDQYGDVISITDPIEYEIEEEEKVEEEEVKEQDVLYAGTRRRDS